MKFNPRKLFSSQSMGIVFLNYAVILVLCNLVLFASAFIIKFNVFIVAAAVASAVGMIAVFSYKTSSSRALKLLGLIIGCAALAIVSFAFSWLIFGIQFSHAMTDWKLQHITKSVSIDSVSETPYLFDDTQVGLRVQINVRLANEIALDQYGLAVVKALKKSMMIDPQGPFDLHGYFASTTFKGQDFDELTTKLGYEGFWVRKKEKAYLDSNDKVRLPAGVYQISTVFLLNGLYFLDRGQAENPKSIESLCKHYALGNFVRPESKESFAKELNDLLQRTATDPWIIQISGDINSRMTGVYGFGKSSPLRYRYEHAQWQATLDSLPLPSCKTLEQEVKARSN